MVSVTTFGSYHYEHGKRMFQLVFVSKVVLGNPVILPRDLSSNRYLRVEEHNIYTQQYQCKYPSVLILTICLIHSCSYAT